MIVIILVILKIALCAGLSLPSADFVPSTPNNFIDYIIYKIDGPDALNSLKRLNSIQNPALAAFRDLQRNNNVGANNAAGVRNVPGAKNAAGVSNTPVPNYVAGVRNSVAVRNAAGANYASNNAASIVMDDSQIGNDRVPLANQESNSAFGLTEIRTKQDIVDSLSYLREVPKRHWSCCMLGVLAGDKDFHCNVEFYSTELLMRNFNRINPRYLNFYERPMIRASVYQTLLSFSKCVNLHAVEFRSCCTSTQLIGSAMNQQQHVLRRNTDRLAVGSALGTNNAAANVGASNYWNSFVNK